jgi:hypothetical protein
MDFLVGLLLFVAASAVVYGLIAMLPPSGTPGAGEAAGGHSHGGHH